MLAANEDVAITTCHIRKHIAFAPDVGPITDTERDDFTAKVSTWHNAIKSYIVNKVKLVELRYYDVPSSPGEDMGGPKKIATLNLLGTSGSVPMAPQVACSVTFKTAERKHWGRFYLPGFSSATLSSLGRWDSVVAQAVATASAGLCSRSGTGANLTVFSKTLWDDVEVSQVQVDDIADVIRRRRYSAPLARYVATP